MEQNDVGSEILLSLPFLFRGKRIAFKIVPIKSFLDRFKFPFLLRAKQADS